jgi:hypothetical protein
VNIETLLKNLDQYRQIEDPIDEVEAIFKALLTEPLRLGFDDDVLKLISWRYYTLHEIYNIPVNGDNLCKLWVLSEDHNPLLFYGVHGSDEDAKGEVSIIDANWVAETCKLAAHKFADLRAESLRKELTSTAVAQSSRITSLGGVKYTGFLNGTVFGSHRNAGPDFNRLLSRPYRAYVRTESALEPVLSLDSIRDLGPQPDEETRVVVTTKDGELEVVRARLVFQTDDNAEDRESALNHMSAEGEWRCDGKNRNYHHLEVRIYQRRPYHWSYESLWMTFDTAANLDAFLSQHATDIAKPGNVSKETHPGIVKLTYWR